MPVKHSREEARSAKLAAATQFRNDRDVTSVGLGMTEDRSDFAVTITVAHHGALQRIPKFIQSIPVRKLVLGATKRL